MQHQFQQIELGPRQLQFLVGRPGAASVRGDAQGAGPQRAAGRYVPLGPRRERGPAPQRTQASEQFGDREGFEQTVVDARLQTSETATLLKHLAQHKARATFFVVGQNVATHPDIVRAR
ncbi:UNVERIFIED_CONTAM: hypothetical protein RKD50_009609 [Streptomyces canus]